MSKRNITKNKYNIFIYFIYFYYYYKANIIITQKRTNAKN